MYKISQTKEQVLLEDAKHRNSLVKKSKSEAKSVKSKSEAKSVKSKSKTN